MAAYPREGGFLPDQDEFDVNLPTNETFLLILAMKDGEIKTRFAHAPDATTALLLGAKTAPDPHNVKIIGAKNWDALVRAKEEFDQDVKRAIEKN